MDVVVPRTCGHELESVREQQCLRLAPNLQLPGDHNDERTTACDLALLGQLWNVVRNLANSLFKGK